MFCWSFWLPHWYLQTFLESLWSPPWRGWPLWNICVTNDHGYVPFVENTSRSFSHSWFITGFITRLTRRVPLVEQELLTLPEYLSSPPVLTGVRVTRFIVLCVCFVNRCLSFWPLCCLFFFDLRILITPLVSSNFSYAISNHKHEILLLFSGFWYQHRFTLQSLIQSTLRSMFILTCIVVAVMMHVAGKNI